MLRKLFTKHPSEVGETYWEHLRSASRISGRSFLASVCQLIHAVLPFFKPPPGTDVNSMKRFLQEVSPDTRKKNNL
jgi:hypothetical protein